MPSSQPFGTARPAPIRHSKQTSHRVPGAKVHGVNRNPQFNLHTPFSYKKTLGARYRQVQLKFSIDVMGISRCSESPETISLRKGKHSEGETSTKRARPTEPSPEENLSGTTQAWCSRAQVFWGKVSQSTCYEPTCMVRPENPLPAAVGNTRGSKRDDPA